MNTFFRRRATLQAYAASGTVGSAAMSDKLPCIYLARHGETEWTVAGKHTGRTDVPLTARGEQNARLLGKRLASVNVQHVFVSPSQRARRTCELAGFSDRATIDPDLAEWDYGQYEGLTTKDIRDRKADWQLFRDGAPGGESPTDISARADRFIARLRQLNTAVLVFSSGHISRVMAARWLNLPVSAGALFLYSVAALSILSYDHDLTEPAIKLWNDTDHLAPTL